MKRMTSISIASVLVAAVAVAVVPIATARPPAGRAIVYSRSTGSTDIPKKNEIFIMEGTGEIRLTTNRSEDAFPNLSPDGTRVAFSRQTGRGYDLLVMGVDGTRSQRLTESDPDEVLPTWSPDGEWLAFTKTFTLDDGNWQSDIFKMRLEDGLVRRVTDTPRAKEFAPDWSPDGTALAFTKQSQRTETYGIALSRPNGRDPAWLVINPQSSSGYTDVNPSWSPDSQWLAFSRDHGEDPFVDIYKVRRDGSAITPVTELNGLAENPAWGNDDRIVFMHNEGLAVVSADGGSVEHITPTLSGRPYWWPDW